MSSRNERGIIGWNSKQDTIIGWNIGMYFLGHMGWGYIFGKTTGHFTSTKFRVQLILMCSVLPDVDILLNIEHGGITHSIPFWLITFSPILLLLGIRNGLPYLVSIEQHILFGDLIPARYKVLYPISNLNCGLGLGQTSPISLSLELSGFLALMLFAYLTGDLMPLFSRDPKNLISLLPAMAMFASFALGLWMRRASYYLLSFEATQALFFLILLFSFLAGLIGMRYHR